MSVYKYTGSVLFNDDWYNPKHGGNSMIFEDPNYGGKLV